MRVFRSQRCVLSSLPLVLAALFAVSLSACGKGSAGGSDSTDPTARGIAEAIAAASASDPFHHVGGCMACHDVTATEPNLFLIPTTIQTPNSGPRQVVFTAVTGPNSFADGDDVYDGICEVCHTQNGHHNNDGHDNTAHFDGQECVLCHLHQTEFAPPYAQGHATHLSADKGPHITCTDCHDSATPTYPAVFADGQDFATTTVCDTCHSPDGTYDGVNDPVIGAKSNWAEGVYVDGDLPAGKEKWCAGCHDDVPSQIQGVSAPNIAGDETATTPYGTGWGFYKTGHGLPSTQVYPASGVRGAGKGCLDCHAAVAAHIDGEPRSYASSGDYLTFDPTASAAYQDGYRLKDVATGYGGKYPLHIPRTGHVYPPGFRESQEFALCFSCHDETALFNAGDPVTGEGAGTNFRNYTGESWTSMHDLHTDGRNGPLGPETPQYDSDYDGVADSRISCPACHNVHGSPSPAMVRHGELISTPGTTDKVPALAFQYTPEGTYPMLADSTGGSTRFIGPGPGSPSKNGVCNMCHNDRTLYERPQLNATAPDAPSNVTPADGSASIETTPILTASAYTDGNPDNTHQASQWQISATPGDYSTPAYDSGATTDLTSHQVAVPLGGSTSYYWRVRYMSSGGAWSGYSAETSFSTVAAGPGTALTLHPSGVASAGAYLVSPGSTWSGALDSNDGDVSYAYLCCTSPNQSFYVDMDDPVGLEGATIQSITVTARLRYLQGPWPNAAPLASNAAVGFKTGSATLWSNSATTGTSGSYESVISQTFTTDSDGGALDVADLASLQVAVVRQTLGPALLRVTEIVAEIGLAN